MTSWDDIKGPVIVSTILAGVLLVGGFLMLGVTGALFAIPAAPVVELIRGMEFGSLVNGDRALGMVFLLTLVVPPAIPVLLWFGLVRFNANIWWGLLVTVIGTWLWSVLVLLYVSYQ